MLEQIEASAQQAMGSLRGDEILFVRFEGEDSDFVRLNQGRVRQPGSVRQGYVDLTLVRGSCSAAASTGLTFGPGDSDALAALVGALRERLDQLPDDPHLMYDTNPREDLRQADRLLPDSATAIDEVLDAAEGLDLVGIWASGTIHAGLLSSLGHRLATTTHPFNLDWSLYHRADKAVKCGYAGFAWDGADLAARMAEGRRQLDIMKRPARTIEPGRYRVYLAPAAVTELLGVLAWAGFGLKGIRTRQSTLLKAVEGKASFAPGVSLAENFADGIAPTFGPLGFERPDRVPLYEGGKHVGSLVDPRSAKEYGVPTTGAGYGEWPEALELGAGTLDRDSVLSELGTGLMVNNLWYLNYSDRVGCRVTGMTRFATLWVEDGEVVAPVDVMRFDETAYRIFGECLVGLTKQRDFLPDAGSYEKRSTLSARTPGALVDGFTFTL